MGNLEGILGVCWPIDGVNNILFGWSRVTRTRRSRRSVGAMTARHRTRGIWRAFRVLRAVPAMAYGEFWRIRPKAALWLVGRRVSSLGASGNRSLAVKPGKSWGFGYYIILLHGCMAIIYMRR